MTSPDDELILRLIDRALLNQPPEAEGFTMSPERIRAVTEGRAKFTPEETAALLRSASTLRFYRHLKLQARADESRTLWESEAVLLAAAGDQPLRHLDFSLPEGEATLYFDYRPEACDLVLQADADLARRCAETDAEIRVLDAENIRLLEGRLDPDGRLEGSWPFEEPPKARLLRIGAHLRLQVKA